MRHIRDPITGFCIVCDKNNIQHFAPNQKSNDPRFVDGRSSRGSYDRGPSPQSNIFYTNHSRYGSRYGSSLSDVGSDDSFGSSRMLRSPTSITKVALVGRSGSPTPSYRRSPSPHRSSSPDRTSESRRSCCKNSRRSRSCCGKKKSRRRNDGSWRSNKVYDLEEGGQRWDRCCGYEKYETATHGAGNWGTRRWCAPLIAILVLLLLAGIAVGLYFGIKAAIADQQRRQQVATYLQNNKVNYVVLGADQPCNPYNNNTGLTTQIPNCSKTTTVIVAASKGFVAPTDPSWAASFAHSLVGDLTPLVATLIWGCFGGGWYMTNMGLI